jgi:hypothetical protein
MSRAHGSLLTALGLVTLAGCGDAGGARLSVTLSARGSAPAEVAIEGGQLRLSQATVALGPLYLCAASSADPELCETAVAEWLDAVSIDALDAQSIALGQLDAISGSVRSAQLDYGISWLLTRNAPEPSPGAEDGHSAVLSGHAEGDDGTSLEFEAAIDIAPKARGASTLSLQLDAHALAEDDMLTLELDPNAWVAQVHYADLLALDGDGDGHVTLAPGDQAYDAIVQSMTGAGVPVFEWLAADAE